MLEEDSSEVKSVSTAVTIAENIVHDIETPFDINHFVYIGSVTGWKSKKNNNFALD